MRHGIVDRVQPSLPQDKAKATQQKLSAGDLVRTAAGGLCPPRFKTAEHKFIQKQFEPLDLQWKPSSSSTREAEVWQLNLKLFMYITHANTVTSEISSSKGENIRWL